MSNKEWLLLDAKDKIVGRLATKVASILIGKNKSDYTPGCDNGDFVIIVNSNEIKFTGNKLEHKFYYKNIITQYDIKPERIVAIIFLEKKPTNIAIKMAKIFGSL